jgi:hypothetical protein
MIESMLEADRSRMVLQRLLARSLSRRSREAAKADALRSLDDLVARAGLRRDEVVTLADIGALNAFGYDRPLRVVAGRAGRPSEWRAVRGTATQSSGDRMMIGPVRTRGSALRE